MGGYRDSHRLCGKVREPDSEPTQGAEDAHSPALCYMKSVAQALPSLVPWPMNST